MGILEWPLLRSAQPKNPEYCARRKLSLFFYAQLGTRKAPPPQIVENPAPAAMTGESTAIGGCNDLVK